MSDVVEPRKGIRSLPLAPIELAEEQHGQSAPIKARRPRWMKPIAIVSIAVPLIIAIVFIVLASVGETPRLDASSEASLETSLQRMTEGMSDAQRKEFLADCMDLTLPDTLRSAFQHAFLSNGPPASNGSRMFKPLQGMTAADIHRKAEAAPPEITKSARQRP